MQSDAPTRVSPQQELIVFAAASLTDAFLEMGRSFEASHPGVKVEFSFAGSQILRTQLEQGAVADVVAFADSNNMDQLVSANLVAKEAPQVFASNHMVVILPLTNPGNVHTLADLGRPGLKLVLADASVPAGNYARQILDRLSQDPAYGPGFSAKVIANVVSNETDVRQVVTKVELGEADAGIVYTSDATAAQDLLTLAIPAEYNVVAKYPIAILTHSPNPALAASFVGYVSSPAGQAVLGKWGFSPAGTP